jgi:hypothetical protein
VGVAPGVSPKVFTFGLLVSSNPVLNLLFTAIFFEIWKRSISASSSARCSPRPERSWWCWRSTGNLFQGWTKGWRQHSKISWRRRDARGSETIAAGSLTFSRRLKARLKSHRELEQTNGTYRLREVVKLTGANSIPKKTCSRVR